MKFTRIAGGQVLLLVGLVIAWFCVGSANVLNASVPYKPQLTEFESRQRMLLEGTLEEYGAIKGRFAHLAELEAQGYLFFDLKNPVTGEKLSESCDRAVPGAICIRLSDPYTLESVWDYDREGNPRVLVHNLVGSGPWRTIREDERDQTTWFSLYRVVKQKGYTEAKVKLVMLGVILSRITNPADPSQSAFREEPYNVIIDPITGKRLSFSDGGFGERVRIIPSSHERGGFELQVLLDGKVVYAAHIFSLKPRKTAYGYIAKGKQIVYLPPLASKPDYEEDPDIP